MTSAEQFEALDGKIDLGFVGLRPALSGHDLLSECVAHDTMLVALPARIRSRRSQSQARRSRAAVLHRHVREDPSRRGNGCSRPARSAGFAGEILQEADSESTAIKFVADGLGVALLPEQITGLPHEGVVFRPLSPPLLRESTIAWRADNPSKPLKDYIQIVKDLSRRI
jgi:DNA-binding transcriptional LysR family regulator